MDGWLPKDQDSALLHGPNRTPMAATTIVRQTNHPVVSNSTGADCCRLKHGQEDGAHTNAANVLRDGEAGLSPTVADLSRSVAIMRIVSVYPCRRPASRT